MNEYKNILLYKRIWDINRSENKDLYIIRIQNYEGSPFILTVHNNKINSIMVKHRDNFVLFDITKEFTNKEKTLLMQELKRGDDKK